MSDAHAAGIALLQSTQAQLLGGFLHARFDVG
jgi:hypothetical protein